MNKSITKTKYIFDGSFLKKYFLITMASFVILSHLIEFEFRRISLEIVWAVSHVVAETVICLATAVLTPQMYLIFTFITCGMWNIISIVFLRHLLSMYFDEAFVCNLSVTIQAATIYLIHLIRMYDLICETDRKSIRRIAQLRAIYAIIVVYLWYSRYYLNSNHQSNRKVQANEWILLPGYFTTTSRGFIEGGSKGRNMFVRSIQRVMSIWHFTMILSYLLFIICSLVCYVINLHLLQNKNWAKLT